MLNQVRITDYYKQKSNFCENRLFHYFNYHKTLPNDKNVVTKWWHTFIPTLIWLDFNSWNRTFGCRHRSRVWSSVDIAEGGVGCARESSFTCRKKAFFSWLYFEKGNINFPSMHSNKPFPYRFCGSDLMLRKWPHSLLVLDLERGGGGGGGKDC